MPQPVPPWQAMAKVMKGVRDSKLGGGKDEFESKSELDELFQGFDVAVVGAKTVGTLNFEELKNGLMNELKFRTNLKNLDHVACGAVIESMRRGFAAVKDIDADGDSSLSRGEFRILLIYLERYYALLQMFKVAELGDTANARAKGYHMTKDQVPADVMISQVDFTTAYKTEMKKWGLTIGNPAAEFKKMALHDGKMMFDEFTGWALTASLQFVPQEEVAEVIDYKARALAAKKELDAKVKKKKAEEAAKKAIEDAKKKELEMRFADVDAVGGAGQYVRPGSTLAVTTSANAVSDYGIADISLYDLDGDGELDVGKEQEMARKAHKKAQKDRMKAEAAALRKQNAELKKKRDYMRHQADAGVMADDMDYMNDDDEDKDFWLARHKVFADNKARMKEENRIIEEENKVYRMRLKQTGHRVDTWTGEAMEPIEQRLKEESEAAHLIAEIRGAVQNMFFKTEVVEKTEAALLSGAVLDAESKKELADAGLESKLNRINELTNSDFPLQFNSQNFIMKDRPHRPYHLNQKGGGQIKETEYHTGPKGVTVKYAFGVPQAVYNADGSTQVALLEKDKEGQIIEKTTWLPDFYSSD